MRAGVTLLDTAEMYGNGESERIIGRLLREDAEHHDRIVVATKFIPPPDLTNTDLQRQRTDGYWHSYIVVGGAVMPAYGEAVSSQEAWHIVNYLRSLAAPAGRTAAKP